MRYGWVFPRLGWFVWVLEGRQARQLSLQALTALDEAEQHLDAVPDGQHELFGFAAPQLAFYRTTCLLRLGRPERVGAAAAEALRLYAGTPQYMDPTLIPGGGRPSKHYR